mmetsp:Transcript_24029/g.55594  ORF Transcript_24029/g.55594 Transcript_24029/m.55594 type:complete len:401 (+) Transcript_24029:2-1204(+)
MAQVGQAVRTFLAVARTVWSSRALTPLRFAFVPLHWVFAKALTGQFVPSGPWMVIWMMLGFASSIQDYKRLATLTLRFMMNKEGAACSLCDSVIGLMLKFDENSPEDIDCSELCPFGINACLNICTNLVQALKESSRYPCVSVGMCPDLDQPPECVMKMPFFSCEPANMCHLVAAFPRPHCELLPGFAVWNKWKSVVGKNVSALAVALAQRPYCSDPGANPSFCITKSTGFGYVCECAVLLLVLLAFVLSIHALETEGSDDDKQWLTFWIITFVLAVFERLSDVILSRFDNYYYCGKFVFVLWLIFARGAEKSYTKFRSVFLHTASALDLLDRCIPQVAFFRQPSGMLNFDSPSGMPARRFTDVLSRSLLAKRQKSAASLVPERPPVATEAAEPQLESAS